MEPDMRILVVGAGAIGGYFGGRLLEAGRDVTFLVRPARAAVLARTGLAIRSRLGDVHVPSPATVMADALHDPFDLVLLSCKAYDLEDAARSFAPAVGPDTAILPLLNGIAHLDVLAARFGDKHVLGGQCLISVALDPDGRVLHLNDNHTLTFGERDGAVTPHTQAIAAAFAGARFDSRLSNAILQEMWEKWVFIATNAGITSLMRASIGDIAAAGGAELAAAMFAESCAIAARQGFAARADAIKRSVAMLTTPGSPLTASMLRDIERGARIEIDHIVGDLLRRGGAAGDHPLLRTAHVHLKAYEARRAREAKAA
jgi:2-dehydropantoate 2-reductase